ncbi:MAG: acyl carrier protein [Steroidobacteraceae bacterium]
MDEKTKIRQFILKNYLFSTDEGALKDEVSLMQAGIIDSTGVLELIMFLEEQFAVKVSDEEMTPDNLDSVERIAAFVGRKR